MPDIAMCSNHICPSKETCYRFKATPGYYQSYAKFTVNEGEDKCDHYWKLESNTTKKGL